MVFFLVLLPGKLLPQEVKKYRLCCIAFYNVENLFDTTDDPLINDDEFLPSGRYSWTSERYREKLNRLSSFIPKIGSEFSLEGPVILGLSEVENRLVLEDLVETDSLKRFNYHIVHFDSPDRRGIDVGLLYQPHYFQLIHATSHRLVLSDNPEYLTRDQLVVSGTLEGDTLYIIVNHWPSRRSGEKKTRPYRIAAGQLSRRIIDSILHISSQAKIILMGDLNDNPTDKSVVKALGSTSSVEHATGRTFYNPMAELYRKGIGSIAWRDTWSLFDQVLVSPALVHGELNSYRFYTAKVFYERFLLQKEGQFKGYPFRTYGGGIYLGGYSDHLPVYIFLYKEVPED